MTALLTLCAEFEREIQPSAEADLEDAYQWIAHEPPDLTISRITPVAQKLEMLTKLGIIVYRREEKRGL